MSNAPNTVAALVLLSAFVLTGCDNPAAPHDHHGTAASSAAPALPLQGALLQEVKGATARFHSQARAARAGYEGDHECISVPGLGGMGFHWVNFDLVDPVFDPLQPEVLLYEPDVNGNEKLVGVEYVVIDNGQEAPTFEGQAFMVGGTPVPVDHWSLHVWVHKENPSGVFTPFNPDVSCP